MTSRPCEVCGAPIRNRAIARTCSVICYKRACRTISTEQRTLALLEYQSSRDIMASARAARISRRTMQELAREIDAQTRERFRAVYLSSGDIQHAARECGISIALARRWTCGNRERIAPEVSTQLPATRTECLAGPRPCPHMRCRYHSLGPRGDCVLDHSDGEARDYEQIGEVLGVSRQRVEEIERQALRKLAKYVDLREFLEPEPSLRPAVATPRSSS